MMPGERGDDPEIQAAAMAPALLFATGKIGCFLPLMAGAVLFFGAAAVRPSLLDSDGRRGWIADAVRPMSWNGINIPILLLSLWLLWEVARSGWRWADQVAVEVHIKGLLFHSTLLRRRKVAWHELQDVRFLPHKAGKGPPQVRFSLADRSVTAKPVENEHGGAERFVQAVQAKLDSRATDRRFGRLKPYSGP
jgi:hypothetical protein